MTTLAAAALITDDDRALAAMISFCSNSFSRIVTSPTSFWSGSASQTRPVMTSEAGKPIASQPHGGTAELPVHALTERAP